MSRKQKSPPKDIMLLWRRDYHLDLPHLTSLETIAHKTQSLHGFQWVVKTDEALHDEAAFRFVIRNSFGGYTVRLTGYAQRGHGISITGTAGVEIDILIIQ